jgi:hypothetical protein
LTRRTELLKGTLDLLILKTLELEDRHGLCIGERMQRITQGAFSVKPGSLFSGAASPRAGRLDCGRLDRLRRRAARQSYQ